MSGYRESDPWVNAGEWSGRLTSDSLVIVTVFHCRGLRELLGISVRLIGLTRRIRASTDGLIASRFTVGIRERRALSWSLWENVSGPRSMGRVQAHVLAARFVGVNHRIATSSAVFHHGGHWLPVVWPAEGAG